MVCADIIIWINSLGNISFSIHLIKPPLVENPTSIPSFVSVEFRPGTNASTSSHTTTEHKIDL